MTIVFYGTGGTIANRGTRPDNYVDYLDAGTVMGAQQLIDLYPRLHDIADIAVEAFGTLRSKYITADHWWQLASSIASGLADPRIEGVVVAHGTGTLEETAWFLHLVLDTLKPVVLVGAQRPGRTIGSDVELNLTDAFRVATDPALGGSGVTVVMNRDIHSARDVTKLANHRLDALHSPVHGPLGGIATDHTVEYWRRPHRPHTHRSAFAASETTLPRVDIVQTYTDADATAIHAFCAAGAKGLVVVGYPPGTVTQPMDAAIDDVIKQGVQVVQATGAVFEPAVIPRAGLTGRGIIANTDIVPTKAKILLQLCLAHGYSIDATAEIFATY